MALRPAGRTFVITLWTSAVIVSRRNAEGARQAQVFVVDGGRHFAKKIGSTFTEVRQGTEGS